MKRKKGNLFTHIANFVTIALIIECFLCSLLVVNQYGKENSMRRIDESTAQVKAMFHHAMEDNRSKLTVFADILGANSSNTEEYLQVLMANFCEVQTFTAVCIHRADGTSVFMGNHPHDISEERSYAQEIARLPYTSGLISRGDALSEKYVYQAVPVVRTGETVGILYGYLSLDTFPDLIDTAAFGGSCRFSIVDGDTGEYLMDTVRDTLGNIYSAGLDEQPTRDGYDLSSMHTGLHNGKSGYYVFRDRETGDWHYTCYQPLEINNWSVQLTIDEDTAFADHNRMNWILLVLLCCVIVLMVVHLVALMLENNRTKKRDKESLHRSNYISEIQRILLKAHTNPDMIDQALKTIAEEAKCETLLLSFADKVVNDVHYWPSQDIAAANELLGRNLRNDFPVFYDSLAQGDRVFFDMNTQEYMLPKQTIAFFQAVDIRNMMMVPLANHSGLLKGALCAVNLENKNTDFQVLECVTYDFFMTLTNVENMAVIRSLGTMDYMTHIKNRNSYETELSSYATADCESLWCMFVDVNGLHEVNNIQGHKAGDRMLCAIADVVKRYFGSDKSYRIGGDEFAMIAAEVSAEELEDRLEQLNVPGDRSACCFSYGYALVDAQEKNPIENAFMRADSNMYRQKKGKKGAAAD